MTIVLCNDCYNEKYPEFDLYVTLPVHIKTFCGICGKETKDHYVSEWVVKEIEADNDIKAGRVKRFDNLDEALEYLDE